MTEDRAISLNAVKDILKMANMEEFDIVAYRNIMQLPPVTSSRPTGHWMYDDEYSDWFEVTYKCSCCKRAIIVSYEARNEVYKDYPYCHCGAKMVESQEGSEGGLI